ncbi:hypothetical protein CRG98_045119, partial [Punica granatum]
MPFNCGIFNLRLVPSWNRPLFFFRKFILQVSFIFRSNIPSRNSMCTLRRSWRHSHSIKSLDHQIESCRELLLPPLKPKELGLLE